MSPQKLLIVLGEESAPSDLLSDAAALFGRAFSSPIVIDLNNNGFEMVHSRDGAHFDIDADGFAEKSGWVKPSDAFLVRDANGNGVIDSQKEMFGTDATSTAAAKLAALDTNKDGFVDSKDTSWGTLRLWKDTNGDGVSQADELFTLASQGVAKLGVAHTTENDRTVAGNVVDWQANWYKSGGVVGGAYGDVLFETNDEDSWYVGSDTTQTQTINPEALLLPLSRGYGVMKALHLAASGSTGVMTALKALDTMALSALGSANQKVADLFFSWAGVTGTKAESGGQYFNQQYIAFMEKLFDHDFVVTGGIGGGAGAQFPQTYFSTSELSNEFGMVWQTLKTRLLVQGPLEPVFTNAYYDFSQDKIIFNDTLANVLARAKALVPASGATAYWQEVGLALKAHADQFGGNADTIQSALDTAAGTHVAIMENWLKGQTGAERFEGSKFADYIDLLGGNDTMEAGGGDDSILGGAGNDVIESDGDNDTLIGGTGNDSLTGNDGDDLYRYTKGDGNDTIYELGDGNDRLIISGYTTTNTVFTRVGNTTDLQITFTGSTTDKILIEDALEIGRDALETITIGSTSRDIAAVRAEVLVKQTTAGNDTIEGFDGIANTISGGGGNDTLIGGNQTNLLNGDAGADTIEGGSNADTINGGAGNDVLSGNSGNDRLSGGTEADIIDGASGNDLLFGDAGADTLDGGSGVDTMNGGTEADVYYFTSGDTGLGIAADHIVGFSRTQGDKIDLNMSGIDASGFVGIGAFASGGVKEFGYTKVTTAGVKSTVIRIDYDNNGATDREIVLDGIHIDLTASDFLY